jgi:hypothetical protein
MAPQVIRNLIENIASRCAKFCGLEEAIPFINSFVTFSECFHLNNKNWDGA